MLCRPMDRMVVTARWLAWCGCVVLLAGCGGAEPAAPTANGVPPTASAQPDTARPKPVPRAEKPSANVAKGQTAPQKNSSPRPTNPNAKSARPPDRSLADLLPPELRNAPPAKSPPATDTVTPLNGSGLPFAPRTRPAKLELPKLDEARLAASGLRKLVGRHLTLYTDLPAQPDVDELPEVFDQAVPQWGAYFSIPAERLKDWQLVGSLMQAPERFERAGLLPAGLPDFKQGFQVGLQLWCYEQPTSYYRRHLLLHEGTHAVMRTLAAGSGPPWYSEGISELLATHRWHEGKLTLQSVPRLRDDAPGWGRIKIVRDDFAAERAKSLEEVMQYGPDAHLQVEPYGWCWAACQFLDTHPKSQKAFRALRDEARDTSFDFSRRFYHELSDVWPELSEDWVVFMANGDYGYDFERNVTQHQPTQPLPDAGATVKIRADRGWQSTGYELQANRGYEIVARGRYRIAAGPELWESEPGGVTLRYHRGLPLGMLLGAIRPQEIPKGKLTPLATPDEIGLGRRAVMERTGTLYLRVNDAPGELADNEGEITVTIRRVKLPQEVDATK